MKAQFATDYLANHHARLYSRAEIVSQMQHFKVNSCGGTVCLFIHTIYYDGGNYG